MAQVLTLLARMLKPGSKLERDIDYPDESFMVFLILSKKIPGDSLKLGHDSFLPHAFHFINITQSFNII
jgi:hypothetical protein